MPTYDYFCNKCQRSFEAVQSMKDSHYKTCPEALCRMETWGKGEVKRQMGTGAGLIFKGSGFYITDYRSESYKEAAKKDSSAGAPAIPAASEGGAKAPEPAKPKADAPTVPAAPKPESPKPSTTNTTGASS